MGILQGKKGEKKGGDSHGDAQSSEHNGPSETRMRVLAISESLLYRLTMATIVVFNVVVMIMETDLRASSIKPEDTWMGPTGHILLTIYVVDLSIRLYCHRKAFFAEPMNIFDLVIVLLDIFLLVLTMWVGELPSVAILRGLRILRIVRVLRGFLIFRELYLMMAGLVSAMRSILFGTILIFLMLTVWSLLSVELLHPILRNLDETSDIFLDCDGCVETFRSVMHGNLYYMRTIIAGDSWGTLAYPLLQKSPIAGIIIIGAFVSVELGLVNVIAAVIVDRQTLAREQDEQLMLEIKNEELHASSEKMKRVFREVDTDGSGTASIVELLDAYDADGAFKEILDLLNISREDLPLIVSNLDKDGIGEVGVDQFVSEMRKLRSLNTNAVLSFVLCSVKKNRQYMHELTQKMPLLEDRMRETQEMITRGTQSLTNTFQGTHGGGGGLASQYQGGRGTQQVLASSALCKSASTLSSGYASSGSVPAQYLESFPVEFPAYDGFIAGLLDEAFMFEIEDLCGGYQTFDNRKNSKSSLIEEIDQCIVTRVSSSSRSSGGGASIDNNKLIRIGSFPFQNGEENSVPVDVPQEEIVKEMSTVYAGLVDAAEKLAKNVTSAIQHSSDHSIPSPSAQENPKESPPLLIPLQTDGEKCRRSSRKLSGSYNEPPDDTGSPTLPRSSNALTAKGPRTDALMLKGVRSQYFPDGGPLGQRNSGYALPGPLTQRSPEARPIGYAARACGEVPIRIPDVAMIKKSMQN